MIITHIIVWIFDTIINGTIRTPTQKYPNPRGLARLYSAIAAFLLPSADPQNYSLVNLPINRGVAPAHTAALLASLLDPRILSVRAAFPQSSCEPPRSSSTSRGRAPAAKTVALLTM
jgi:hypothetical protein